MRKPWDQWHPFIFYFPVYFYIILKLIFHLLRPGDLLRVNSGLPIGGFGQASKYEVNKIFKNKKEMLRFIRLDKNYSVNKNVSKLNEFMYSNNINYPIILKPDTGGRVGKGVILLRNEKEVKLLLSKVIINYLAQEYCTYPEEYSLFYYRLNGQGNIFSMDQKIFPHVVGDGKKTTKELVQKHPEYCYFEQQYSQDILNIIPKKGSKLKLSVVGNYTQGGTFKDISNHKTDELLRVTDEFTKSTNFNYGRLDLMAKNINEFKKGNYKVIEVNGVDALSTNFHDAKYSLKDIYTIFFAQVNVLIKIAKEKRKQKMVLPGPLKLIRELKQSEKNLEKNHQIVLELKKEIHA